MALIEINLRLYIYIINPKHHIVERNKIMPITNQPSNVLTIQQFKDRDQPQQVLVDRDILYKIRSAETNDGCMSAEQEAIVKEVMDYLW